MDYEKKKRKKEIKQKVVAEKKSTRKKIMNNWKKNVMTLSRSLDRARDRVKQLFNVGINSSKGMVPERVAGVLDQLNERDQQSPRMGAVHDKSLQKNPISFGKKLDFKDHFNYEIIPYQNARVRCICTLSPAPWSTPG